MEGITITLTLTLKAEVVDAFCAGLDDTLKDTAKFPGFRSIRIIRHDTDPSRVLLIEDWDSKAAYGKYIAWRTERGDMDGMSSMIAAPPLLEFWSKSVAAADKDRGVVGG